MVLIFIRHFFQYVLYLCMHFLLLTTLVLTVHRFLICESVFLLLVLQIGDEVAISTTSYNASETEKRWITAVSADSRILTLNQPLSYTHIGQSLPMETEIFELFMFIFNVTASTNPAFLVFRRDTLCLRYIILLYSGC